MGCKTTLFLPTNNTVDDIKEEFYQSLDQIAQRLSSAKVDLCLGDFNAMNGTLRDGFALHGEIAEVLCGGGTSSGRIMI